MSLITNNSYATTQPTDDPTIPGRCRKCRRRFHASMYLAPFPHERGYQHKFPCKHCGSTNVVDGETAMRLDLLTHMTRTSAQAFISHLDLKGTQTVAEQSVESLPLPGTATPDGRNTAPSSTVDEPHSQSPGDVRLYTEPADLANTARVGSIRSTIGGASVAPLPEGSLTARPSRRTSRSRAVLKKMLSKLKSSTRKLFRSRSKQLSIRTAPQMSAVSHDETRRIQQPIVPATSEPPASASTAAEHDANAGQSATVDEHGFCPNCRRIYDRLRTADTDRTLLDAEPALLSAEDNCQADCCVLTRRLGMRAAQLAADAAEPTPLIGVALAALLSEEESQQQQQQQQEQLLPELTRDGLWAGSRMSFVTRNASDFSIDGSSQCTTRVNDKD